MREVSWTKLATDQLATFWVQAGDRRRLNDAVEELDRLLARDPFAVGESRDDDLRVMIQDPLVAYYRVVEPHGPVYVLSLRMLG